MGQPGHALNQIDRHLHHRLVQIDDSTASWLCELRLPLSRSLSQRKDFRGDLKVQFLVWRPANVVLHDKVEIGGDVLNRMSIVGESVNGGDIVVVQIGGRRIVIAAAWIPFKKKQLTNGSCQGAK